MVCISMETPSFEMSLLESLDDGLQEAYHYIGDYFQAEMYWEMSADVAFHLRFT